MNWKNIFAQNREDINLNRVARIVLLFLVKLVCKLFYKVTSNKVELPKESKVFAANHVSLMDAFAVCSILPKEEALKTIFISKDKYAHKNFVFSFLSRIIGVLSVGKSTTKTLATAEKALRDGYNLMIFPEGTRNSIVKPFKKTFAILAYESKSVIIPLAIKKKGRDIDIKFLKPIEPNKDYKEVSMQTYKAIKNSLNHDII